MNSPVEIGNTIYAAIEKRMKEQTLNYQDFIEAGKDLTEEEKTARVLEVVHNNIGMLWSLFLVSPQKKE